MFALKWDIHFMAGFIFEVAAGRTCAWEFSIGFYYLFIFLVLKNYVPNIEIGIFYLKK